MSVSGSFFFAIFVLQRDANPPYVDLDIGYQSHDSGDVFVGDRRLDFMSVADRGALRKTLFQSRLVATKTTSSPAV